jgi:hypothetical protein
MNEDFKKIERCFERLQRLEIKPTLENMETLLQTLYDLRDVYNDLRKAWKEGEEDGGAEINTCGRDNA